MAESLTGLSSCNDSFISLCKGRRGQQPLAQGQGSTNGMAWKGRVGGVCDSTVTPLGACFRESIACVTRCGRRYG